MNQQRLLRDELNRGNVNVLDAVHVAQDFEGGPVILNLPKEIRQENHKGNEPSQPNPSFRQVAPLAGNEQREEKAESEKQHRMLVQNPNARCQSEKEPQPLVPGSHDAQSKG